MKKYEYLGINLHTKVKAIRAKTPRHSEGDEILLMEIINEKGKEGWRWANPPNVQEAVFEREADA